MIYRFESGSFSWEEFFLFVGQDVRLGPACERVGRTAD